MSKNILIVDDDSDLTYIIAEMLEEHGYDMECTGSADDAFSILAGRSFDLILLDINLPDSSGFEICSELRRVSTVPVIFASARTSETDRITGFDIGGDDYLPKPYSMKELLSRVNALMRRVYGFGSEETVSFGDISVDISGRSVTRNGIPLTLSLREFDLLSFLCRNRNKPIPKEELLSEVWGAFSMVEPSTLAVHIRWLREKLEKDPSKPEFIKTVFKVGYILEV